jgi:hypothetical protein
MDREAIAPGLAPAARVQPERTRRLAGTGVERKGGKEIAIPAPVRAILRRDAIWTIAVALVTVAAYVPTLYGPSWGTLGDYAGAFAAGFLGKAVINWAALPAFRSLKPKLKGNQTGAPQGALTDKPS